MAQEGTSLDTIRGTGAEVVRGDLLDRQSLDIAVKGIDTVFHLAARVGDFGPAKSFMRVNVDGTRDLLDTSCSNDVRRFVLVSSVAVHSLSAGGIEDGHEELPRDNTSMPYAVSKIGAEDLVNEAHESGRIEGVIVRPGLFPFGPQDRTTMLPLVSNLDSYRHVSGGRAILCTSYAGNLAHGIALAGEVERAAGRTYVISDDRKVTWRDLMDALCDALDRPGIRKSIPFPVAFSAATVAEFVARALRRPPLLTRYRVLVAGRDCWFGCERARKELGYEPEIGLERGIEMAVEWVGRAVSQ